MTDTGRTIRRASKSGYHFINLFQQCPRKWWIHYGLGVIPVKTGKALIYGKAWHEALAVFYATQEGKSALDKGLSELEAMKLEYQSLDDYNTDREKMAKMVPLWCTWCAGILENYDVVEYETEYTIELVSGARMTIRPDAVLREKSTGSIVIAEHKSTSWSVDNMIHTVDVQDQATAYLFGLAKARPDLAPHLRGILLDVAYARVYKGKVSDTGMIDSAIIYRTARDFAEFEISMAGLFAELGQKYLAWKSKSAPIPFLFPRNGMACSQFGCEYETICRSSLTPEVPLGSEFERDPLVGSDEDLLAKVALIGPGTAV